MTSESDVPHFLRLSDLQERGIAMTHQAVRHMQMHEGFPLGRLLGPGTRVWTKSEINGWLSSRPVEVSEQARRRATAANKARKFNFEARQAEGARASEQPTSEVVEVTAAALPKRGRGRPRKEAEAPAVAGAASR
jgi:hypothetical protein